MERLTAPQWSNRHYHVYANVCPKRKDMEHSFQSIVDKLGRYEDTDLTPEEITAALEELAELKEKTRWIPVSERPPKENEYRDKQTGELIPILVCEKGTELPFRAVYDGKRWGDGFSEITVIYWMPLPELPVEENNPL